MKLVLSIIVLVITCLSFGRSEYISGEWKKHFSQRVLGILADLTLEQKVGQMTQLNIDLFVKDSNKYEIDLDKARNYASQYFVGSILNSPTSGGGQAPNSTQWVNMIGDLQRVFTSEGSKIPLIYGLDSVHGANYIHGATMFGQQINGGASFNRELVKQMGEVTAKDTRAIGCPWTFSPILDLATMPIWPRVYETFGEDTHLVSEMGKSIVQGYQGNPIDLSNPTKVAACMKHFIGYGNPRSGQDQNPNWIPDRFLYDYYAPPFQSAINAGVATAMESYNDVNGEPICASKKYLKDLLRDKMGFKGLLVTDWEEIRQLHNFHKIASTPKEAVRIAISETSIDMSMVPSDNTFFEYLVELVQEGSIPESRIDESVARILQLKEDLGLFDSSIPDPSNPLLGTIGSQEDREKALNLARESITLLQNNGILPLSTDKQKRVFVTGPSSDALNYMSGGWTINWQGIGDDNMFAFGTTVLEGITNIVNGQAEIVHRRGCKINGESDQGERDEAIQQAQQSDVVVVCLGEDHYTEFFGNIQDLTLPTGQIEYLQALVETNKPVILVLFEGRPRVLTTSNNGNNVIDRLAGVVLGFLPGPEGGQALAEILYGHVNPSGRLPISYPKTTGLIAQYWHKVTEGSAFLWEFGHGLSYSNFEYHDLKVNSTMRPQDTLPISVKVKNHGPYAGKVSVLLYVSDVYRRIVPEEKLLKRFEKISLENGEEKEVAFSLTIEDLSYHGIDNEKVYETGEFRISIGSLSATFSLVN